MRSKTEAPKQARAEALTHGLTNTEMHVSLRKIRDCCQEGKIKAILLQQWRDTPNRDEGPRRVLTNFMSAVCGCVGNDGGLPQRRLYICPVDRSAAGKGREGGRKVVIRGGSPQ